MSNDSCTTTTKTDDNTIYPATTTISTISKSQLAALKSLSTIIPSLSSSSSSSSLLHDQHISSQISSLLRQPDSAAGDNNLCRWLYDTFQSSDLDLQHMVIRFLPLIAGLYLSRIPLCIPLPGFEAVLLALYAFETASRNGQSVTINVPDLYHPSPYHETKEAAIKNNNSTGLNLTILSPTLEPHGTVRSTRRARIVGVALELYFKKIYEMSIQSKIEFCEFCVVWAGEKEGSGRVPLPSELLQPILRILGHCLLCPNQNKKVVDAAREACKSLYARSMHDINPNAILATRSLIKLAEADSESDRDWVDPTEIPKSKVITL